MQVCVVADEPIPPKPDAVFPNNWVSWHADGTVVLYPMQAPNRRLERRRDILESVAERCGYRIDRVLDLSGFEEQGRFLEGTGSLVLDHVRRLAFACRSTARMRRWCGTGPIALGYQPVVFDAVDAAGAPFYHTNVMLSIGCRVAVVAADGHRAGGSGAGAGGTGRRLARYHRHRPAGRGRLRREHAGAAQYRGTPRVRAFGACRPGPAAGRANAPCGRD